MAEQRPSVDAAIAASATTAAVGFIPASGVTSTPAVTAPSALKKKHTPLETAELGLERLVQKLQWPNPSRTRLPRVRQRISKPILYLPNACRVKSKFLQPIERAKEGTAYQSLRARADAKCKEWSLERGAFHLEMRNINNDERRLQLLEHAATSIWRMARILLASIQAMVYDPHNLVADMLLVAHDRVLRELCDLEEFVSIYKRVHKCGREAEDPNVMYVRRFGTADESDDNAPPTVDTNTSPITASAVQNVNENPPASVETTTKVTPVAKLFDEPNELTVEALNKHWQDKVALLLAAGLPDSRNIQQMVQSSKQLQDLSTFGQQLISQVGGFTSSIASEVAKEVRPSTNMKSKEGVSKSSTPPKLIWNSYKREFLFTREETAEESEVLRQTLDVSMMRKVLCKNHCLINSIRPANFALPSDNLPPVTTTANVPPGSDPPQFHARHQSQQPPVLSKRLRDIPLEQFKSITETLTNHVNKIFYECVRMFKTTSRDIKISEYIASSENELRKSKAAGEAAGVKFRQEKSPNSPLLHESMNKKIQTKAKEQQRKTDNKMDGLKRQFTQECSSLRNELKQERAKRQKLENDMAQLKAQGGPSDGAHQTNTTTTLEQALVPQRSTTLRTPKESPKLSRKKRRKQQYQNHKEKFSKSRGTPPGGQGGDLHLSELNQPTGVLTVEEANQDGRGRGRGRGRGGSVNMSYVREQDSNQGRGRGNN
eukprot:scaffold91562_cov49-Cyclotella_meneghiniana.AAC.4